MTRAIARDHEVKRQAILKKSAELFASAGFLSARLQDVATDCGTSKSNLYHYFPRKEDLLYAIINEHISSSLVELEAAAQGPGTPRERLQQMVRVFVKCAANRRNEHLVLTNDLKFLPLSQQREIKLKQSKAVDLVVELLQAINPTLMRSRRTRSSYALMLYGTMIWTFSWYHKSGAMKPRELADRLSALFLNGFEGGEHPPDLR
jgi:AcrR family transcriptional regulator